MDVGVGQFEGRQQSVIMSPWRLIQQLHLELADQDIGLLDRKEERSGQRSVSRRSPQPRLPTSAQPVERVAVDGARRYAFEGGSEHRFALARVVFRPPRCCNRGPTEAVECPSELDELVVDGGAGLPHQELGCGAGSRRPEFPERGRHAQLVEFGDLPMGGQEGTPIEVMGLAYVVQPCRHATHDRVCLRQQTRRIGPLHPVDRVVAARTAPGSFWFSIGRTQLLLRLSGSRFPHPSAPRPVR